MEPSKMCNGTRIVVKNLHNNSIMAKITTGSYKGQHVLTPLMATDSVLSFRRKQFSVRLACAITVNKSQGE